MPLLTRVAAPRATVPVHSLIRAAVTTLDDEPGWERGLTYAPESPGGYRAFAACTDADYDDEGAGPTPVVAYWPWDLQVVHPCHSTFGLDEEQLDAELTRAVDATESYAIARELWQGDLTRAAATAGDVDAPNLSLVDGPTVLNGGAPAPPKLALALLEEALGDALRGQQAYLHASRRGQPFVPDTSREGNLLTNFNRCFDEIGYVQTGDVPGRKEPGTGETNYRNIFKHLYDKGYKGIVGMEHGNSKPGKEGVMAVIQSYRDADNFPIGKAPPTTAAR